MHSMLFRTTDVPHVYNTGSEVPFMWGLASINHAVYLSVATVHFPPNLSEPFFGGYPSRLMSVMWRYTKVNRYKVLAMHFMGLN
jgi:hypothetical protein